MSHGPAADIHIVILRRRQFSGHLNMTIDKDVDAKGLNCPLPILRTKKALSELSSGQLLRVQATDPGAIRDFQAFSKQTGNELVSQDSNEGTFTFVLKKK